MTRVSIILTAFFLVGCGISENSGIATSPVDAKEVAAEALQTVRNSFEFEYSYSSEREEIGRVIEDYQELVIEGQPANTAGLSFLEIKPDLLKYRDERSRQFLESTAQSTHFGFIRRKVGEKMLRALKILGGNGEQYEYYLRHAVAGNSTEYRLMLNSLERVVAGSEQSELAALLLTSIETHEAYFADLVKAEPEMMNWTLQNAGERSSMGEFLSGVSDLEASLLLY